MKKSSRPLMVFVHVPKTAGSTINAALHNTYENGCEHVENIFGRSDFLSNCAEWDWISGHIPLPDFEARLAGIDRELRYFISLREPTKQLASHINWLNEIRFRGEEFFYNHPREIQLISFEAAAVDYSNPCALQAFLLKYHSLFLNNQATYVWGRSWETLGLEQRQHALRRFEIISDSSNLKGLAAALGVALPNRRINNAIYRFETKILYNAELQSFLKYHHAGDQELYRMVGLKLT